MWTFPSLEPAVVSDGVFVIDRLLDRAGEVIVRVGDVVTPEMVVARALSSDKAIMLFVANELGVPSNSVQRYLTRPVGSKFKKGEAIARAGGLRKITVSAPADGVVVSADEQNGALVYHMSSGQAELLALVSGEVERVVPERGAVIRSFGHRLFGIVGFGHEAIGHVTVGSDRGDRELTPDLVKDAWKGRIVVCGMTVGVPALNKLKQVGVAGIIVGSLSEADIRRFLTTGSSSREARQGQFWTSRHPEAPFASASDHAPFAIVATEGFGRIPMAETVFDFLREHEDASASLMAATSVGSRLRRPEVYISGKSAGDGTRGSDELLPGRPVRIVSGRMLGAVATCRTAAYDRRSMNGVATLVAEVELPGGELRDVPVSNLEVLR
ncbi:MAG TPA: hypothetical protein VMM78_09705 [Thermomicrobiales bacterium]|nr:hypothetical protein [Thermomicrobiales bacterium]